MPWSEELEEVNHFLDLNIADTWGIGKKYFSGSIFSTLYIRETLCKFKEKKILNGKISISLPNVVLLEETNRDIVTYMYSICASSFQPVEIYYSADWNCGFLFSLRKNENDFAKVYDEMIQNIDRTQPEAVYYDKDIREFLTFTVKGYDEQENQYYTFPFVVNKQQTQLIGFISCYPHDAAIWKKISYDMIGSINFVEGGIE